MRLICRVCSKDEQLATEHFDLLIVGGGINGTGIAVEAAGRGLKVLLCEKNDLGSATSSASSKLIHGGLRYLEHMEFKLVREALTEREVLLKRAPHLIYPLRFVLPHDRSMRPSWMIRLGLFLYDNLGRRQILPASEGVNLRTSPLGEPLENTYKKGFAYSDCWADDARLVVLNALAAKNLGAQIHTRTKFISARPAGKQWHIAMEDQASGNIKEVSADVLVNAAGPWVQNLAHGPIASSPKYKQRLVKGSHILLPKLYKGDQAYILQADDKRIIFAIPFSGTFTLVGTTDVAYEGDPSQVSASQEEIEYLCGIINQYFEKKVSPTDVVWDFAGVRPLLDEEVDNPSKVSRDYSLKLDAPDAHPPLLSVLGGKLTTYRVLGEDAINTLKPFFKTSLKEWSSAEHTLPGGDISNHDFEAFYTELTQAYPNIPASLLYRIARAYGTSVHSLLEGVSHLDDLGHHFGGQLYEREVRFLCKNEWAATAEDILWRRTKEGLHVNSDQVSFLEAWLKEHR